MNYLSLYDKNVNLLNEYFEALSSNKAKPQVAGHTLGANEMERSKNILFLLSFLLLCVYKYDYEKAKKNFNMDFIMKNRLSGLMKYIQIPSSQGFLPISNYLSVILFIIYEEIDIETNVLPIYQFGAENCRKFSPLYNEYYSILQIIS